MKRLGLTGGVASGKSTVAASLKRHGLRVVNLDTVGRHLVDSSPQLAVKIAEICGPYLLKDGHLNRRALREHLFTNPEARRRVEELLHPLIWKEFEKECAKARDEGAKLVVCEAALLVEANLHSHLDGLVVVIASEDARLKRLVRRDAIDMGLATQMVDAQVGDEARRQAATYLIHNDGSLADLEKKVEQLVGDLRARGWL